MQVNLKNTKEVVRRNATKNGLSKSNTYSCRIHNTRVKVSSVLCVQCSQWIHSRYAGMRRVTTKSSRNIACRKCKEDIGEAVKKEVM